MLGLREGLDTKKQICNRLENTLVRICTLHSQCLNITFTFKHCLDYLDIDVCKIEIIHPYKDGQCITLEWNIKVFPDWTGKVLQ